MPTNDKQSMLAKLEAAKLRADDAQKILTDATAAVEAAQKAAQQATEDAELAHNEAFAAEIAAHQAEVEANERRDHDGRAKQQAKLDARKAKAKHASIDHTAIKTVAIDGAVHEVVAGHGLFVGSHGVGAVRKEAREGSRYTVACGLSVDTPHDELHHERFDTAAVDCKGCKAALEAMQAGEIPDRRSDYLTSEEQLAHARAQQAERNKASSGPDPT